jgi:hypothetical protein
MSHELVLVFFRSSDKLSWDPVERNDIPEWLRNDSVIERLIAGECIRNVEAEDRKGMMWWTALAIDRKEPDRSALLLPDRLVIPVH